MRTLTIILKTFFLISFEYYGFGSAYHYDTIVVGMGAAGTAAASALAQAGKRVLALEAQGYIGGRVKTFLLPDGVVEMGAEWIHGSENNILLKLAQKANLSLLPQEIYYDIYYTGGILNNTEPLKNLVYYGLDLVKTRPVVPQALGQYVSLGLIESMAKEYPKILKSKEFLTAFLDMMDLVIDNDKATDNWNQYSTESCYEELEGVSQTSWHSYGYKTLFEILLNTYNNGPGYPNLDILMNKEVVHISWPKNPRRPVRVTCRDGTIYRADNVIITVSLGVLKERYATLFTPKLPVEKTNAIHHVGMGTVSKIILTFNNTWWPENCSYFGFIWKTEDRVAVDHEDYWTTRIFGATCPKASPKSITLWPNGEVAKIVEKLSDETVRIKSMEMLRKFMAFNATVTDPVSVLRSSWFSNPFTRGTYSYDSLLTPIYPNGRYDLAQPLRDSAGKPRVLFAGEATNSKHFSTVHGATESGFREAERLLDPANFNPSWGC